MEGWRQRALLFAVDASTVVAWLALFATAVGVLAVVARPQDNRYVSAAFGIVGLFGAVLASGVGTLVAAIGLGLAQWKDLPRRQLTLAFGLNLLALVGGLVFLKSL